MTRHLLVPGRNKPRPEHWQQRWADAHPGYVWAPPPPGPPLVLEEARPRRPAGRGDLGGASAAAPVPHDRRGERLVAELGAAR